MRTRLQRSIGRGEKKKKRCFPVAFWATNSDKLNNWIRHTPGCFLPPRAPQNTIVGLIAYICREQYVRTGQVWDIRKLSHQKIYLWVCVSTHTREPCWAGQPSWWGRNEPGVGSWMEETKLQQHDIAGKGDQRSLSKRAYSLCDGFQLLLVHSRSRPTLLFLLRYPKPFPDKSNPCIAPKLLIWWRWKKITVLGKPATIASYYSNVVSTATYTWMTWLPRDGIAPTDFMRWPTTYTMER